jgi:hypothetical protein
MAAPRCRLVGIAGTNCSGKDTAGDHLAVHFSFQHASLSSVLRDEARRRGLGVERPTLIQMNVELRRELGPGGVVLRAISTWDSEPYPGGLVISSVRVVCEAEEILRQGGDLLFIDAPVEVRYARSLLRPRPEDRITSLADFIAQEEAELAGLEGPDRPWLREVQRLAGSTIVNDGPAPEYFRAVEARLGLIFPGVSPSPRSSSPAPGRRRARTAASSRPAPHAPEL